MLECQMSEDGTIDYSRYSLEELLDIREHIVASRYPINFRNLQSAIEAKQSTSEPLPTRTDQSKLEQIPVGRHGLIEIPMERKYINAFRAVMLLVAVPFLLRVYDVLGTGVADLGTHIVERGDGWGYYAHLFKHAAFSIFFLWLGSFGVKAKRQDTPKES